MSRLQLALNVADLDEAVEFYTKMFGIGPAKTKPGYANFAIAEPPLKLVLFEGAARPARSTTSASRPRPPTRWWPPRPACPTPGSRPPASTTPCAATPQKTETWVTGPDGTRWEWYVKTGDTDQLDERDRGCRRDRRLGRTPAANEPVAVGAMNEDGPARRPLTGRTEPSGAGR